MRTGPGTNYAAKKHSQLTADGQKHDKDNDGCLDAGTVITCKAALDNDMRVDDMKAALIIANPDHKVTFKVKEEA